MNTNKQVNLMVGLLFLLVVAVAMYWLWDPIRADNAEAEQTEKAAERGAALFATFCRTCHGNQGMGRLERTDLPGLPLNLEDNRPTGELKLEQLQARIRDTIVCGRVGTIMPSWSLDQGGPLNGEQIRQLVVLITTNADDAWEKALERANHADETGKHVKLDVAPSDTAISLDDASGLPREISDRLRIGAEVVRIVEVRGNDLVVERGQLGTKAEAHPAGAPVYEPPIDPPAGPMNEDACGQIARSAPAPSSPTPGGGPAPTPQPGASATFQINMGDNFFEAAGQRNPAIAVATGQNVTFNLDNKGRVPHNLRIAGPDNAYDNTDDLVSKPDLIRAGESGSLSFSLSKTGTITFRCDFHPTDMTGTLVALAP